MALLTNAGRCLQRVTWSLGLTVVLSGAMATQTASEPEVKAALLYHLAQFVEWPPGVFAHPHDPLIIGVLGPDPFGRYLQDLVRVGSAGSRRVIVEYYRDVLSARRCHVLYVNPNERDHLQSLFAALEGRPVLTVSDFDGFLRRGGMVRFYRSAENKIRVQLNLEATRAAGLTISAKLLRVVVVVPPEEE